MSDNTPDWVSTADTCVFPILASSRRKLISLLENEQDIKINDLLEISRLDPGVAITLLRHAGTNQKKEITTLSHAILLISIPQTVKILGKLPVLEKTLPAQTISRIKHLYTRQYLTAFIAREWSILRKESETNELFTAGLNRGYFHLILFLLDVKKADELDKLLLSNKPEQFNQELELLGNSVNELSWTIAKRWRLPELILESYSGKHHNPKVTGIRLATELVLWIYSHSSIQYSNELCSHVAEYIRLPLDQTAGTITKAIVKTIRQIFNKLSHQPLLKIVMSYPSQIAPTTNTKIVGDKKTLANYVSLLHSKNTPKSTRDMIEIAVKALRHGIGFSRVLFMSFNKKENCLTEFIQETEKSLSDFKHISISLELNKLFNQLSKKEQTLIVNPGNQHKYCDLLHPMLRPLTANACIIISSIYINNRLIGCIFVDHGKINKQLTENEMLAYKYVCKELKAAIESFLLKSITKKVA